MYTMSVVRSMTCLCVSGVCLETESQYDKGDWSAEHGKCRSQYIGMLQIQNPDSVFQMDKPGDGKNAARMVAYKYYERCKRHSIPMYVWRLPG